MDFAEASLLSSGVLDAKDRKRYLARVDKLEADARRNIGNAKTPFSKGQALLTFLHSGPLSEGYEAKQTSVSTILDKGTFNCVSSATLFTAGARVTSHSSFPCDNVAVGTVVKPTGCDSPARWYSAVGCHWQLVCQCRVHALPPRTIIHDCGSLTC